MTMLSFRIADGDAVLAREWSERLGIDRSELLRNALHAYLVGLASEVDAGTWADHPLTENEASLAEVADWGPAEDWAEWGDDAAR